MYPIMVKIDFTSVISGQSGKPVWLTLVCELGRQTVHHAYAIALFFLGFLFRGSIGAAATDLVKMPFGMDLAVGATHGAGIVVLHEGVKMLQVPLWRSYFAGCILLGIAPCTAMVLVWGYLARGNDGLTLIMVAINSLTMLLLYGLLGGFLLGVGRLPVPWQALLLSIVIYVALPLVAGYLSRKWIIQAKGDTWFTEKFLHVLTPVTILALLTTLVLLFSFKGETILGNPLTILWIAIPLFIQTMLIFWLGYGAAKLLKLSYRDAAPAAMIGASNHFEVAIATATMLFGLSSGAALATVVGVLIEVPLMLWLVRICLRTQKWSRRVWRNVARAMNVRENLSTACRQHQRSMRAVNLGLGANLLLAAVKPPPASWGTARRCSRMASTPLRTWCFLSSCGFCQSFAGRKLADCEHPYGHNQMESIAALVCGAFMGYGGGDILGFRQRGVRYVYREGRSNSRRRLHALGGAGTVVIKIALTVVTRPLAGQTGNAVVRWHWRRITGTIFRGGARWESLSDGWGITGRTSGRRHCLADRFQKPAFRLPGIHRLI